MLSENECAQGLDKQHSEYQELVRTSPGHHYVKVACLPLSASCRL